jgi:malate dehydrogenase (oxaloacetate-decarboxylating)
VVVGAGAAGTACTDILLARGVREVVVCDRHGALYKGAGFMTAEMAALAERTNPHGLRGTPDDVLVGADLLLGVSAPGAFSAAGIEAMGSDAVVFALANPSPEIRPEYVPDNVAIMATGRTDYPNQINNVLAFPGVFKGALAARASRIDQNMQLAAAGAIADIIAPDELHAEYIVPSVFNRSVADSVAEAVADAATASGLAGHPR